MDRYPWWWPTGTAVIRVLDRATLMMVVGVLLYGLFVPAVDNKDIFSLLTMLVGFYIGDRRHEAREARPI